MRGSEHKTVALQWLATFVAAILMVAIIALYAGSASAGLPADPANSPGTGTGAHVNVPGNNAAQDQVSQASLPGQQSQSRTVGAPKMQLTGLSTSIETKASRGPNSEDVVLWDRYDYAHPSASTSQKFEADFANYDSQVADNFFISGNDTWVINQIEVAGVYSGTGVADSVNVFIYSGTPSAPGSVVISQTNIPYLTGPEPGDFVINLSQPVTLTGGDASSFWLSIQANENYRQSGQWFWRNRQFAGSLYPPFWRNPGNGYNKGCVDWAHRDGCGLSGDAHSQVFRLSGADLGILPTATGTPPTATRTVTPPGTATPVPTTGSNTPSVPSPVLTKQIRLSPTIAPTVGSPSPTLTPPPACGLEWRIVPGPSGMPYIALNDVETISTNDVWAVGGGASQAETIHWDGTSWTEIPNSSPGDSSLSSVDALSASDIWAVGTQYNLGDPSPLIMHWDGTQWSVVSSPGGDFSDLLSIDAISTNDVWAVGDDSNSQTLIEHWDGTAWSIIPSANHGTDSTYLESVSGASTNDVWAAGQYIDSIDMGYRTFIEHWNGTQWSEVSSPNLPATFDTLSSVGALSSNDAWAVGESYQPNGEVLTLTLHWDGTNWSIVPSPNPGPLYAARNLLSLSVISSSDAWAVGYYHPNLPPDYTTYGLAMHWDGTSWNAVTNPAQTDPFYSILNGVSILGDGDVWAVGISGVVPDLIMQYSSPCASPTPTVATTDTPTNTPAPSETPTNTRTSTPTNTALSTDTPALTHTPATTATPTEGVTLTPTVCTVQFTDVRPGSTFYPFVRCLACLGIINGYPNGTFKPNNNVTRGQLSKIVSNSAGFSDPQPNQMFQDVPLNSTFQLFIGRLASRGYINGYVCGGQGEPCGPGNLPYFRPNNNATRGQISKIVSNAAAFNDPAGSQLFEDVLPNSAFYDFIQRLANKGVMSGYPCGGPREPCGPGNLPYFRPGNNATRGQTSKIVGNTFFAGCAILASR